MKEIYAQIFIRRQDEFECLAFIFLLITFEDRTAETFMNILLQKALHLPGKFHTFFRLPSLTLIENVKN